jgi:hypothetical protein
LLSLSQISSTCELMADKVIVDSMNINVSSTSCSESLSVPFLITIANNDQSSKYIYTTGVTLQELQRRVTKP